MRTYYCKIDKSHEGFTDLNSAISHILKEVKEKKIDTGKNPLSTYLEVIDD